MPHQGIELRTVLTPDLDDVLEAAVRHEDHTGAASLQESVRRDR
jgi:hypothetical protein